VLSLVDMGMGFRQRWARLAVQEVRLLCLPLPEFRDIFSLFDARSQQSRLLTTRLFCHPDRDFETNPSIYFEILITALASSFSK
jgi:hypothetical protein